MAISQFEQQIQARFADIVRRTLGSPNQHTARRDEWRYGTNDSLSVMVGGENVGVWHDHETKRGGGVWDFLNWYAGLTQRADAEDWLERNFGIEREEQQKKVATYTYVDETGKTLFWVYRYGPKKSFSQAQPGPGKPGKPMHGVRYVPYHLDEITAAREAAAGAPWRVYICEGEKDVDRVIHDWGVTATTNPGGAGKWRAEYNQFFAGADVVVLPHNDAAGRGHGSMVATHLVTVAASVRVLQLSGLPEKGDISDWLDRGGTQSDFEALLEETPLCEPPSDPADDRRFRFPLVRFADIALTTSVRCIVEDLIPRESLVICWGPPKCGKSFWIFDLVMHVALGREYRGKAVECGAVVYIAAEGELGIKARAHAFQQARMAETGEDPPFYLLTTRLDLVEDIDELVGDIKAQLPDEQCLIIVIDTLNRTIHGSESKDDDMGAYRDAADRLRVEFHAAVIIIHHCGVDGTRPRGHTGLTGACDAQLAVKKDVDNSILVTLELMKDGIEGEMMRGRLGSVEVGLDVNDKPITSCVIEHLDAPPAGERRNQRKLSPGQQRALTLLYDAVNTAGEVPPSSGHIPSGKACVKEELWRDYCYQGGISGGDTHDAQRKAFKRAAETLVAAGRVGCWEDWVWIP